MPRASPRDPPPRPPVSPAYPRYNSHTQKRCTKHGKMLSSVVCAADICLLCTLGLCYGLQQMTNCTQPQHCCGWMLSHSSLSVPDFAATLTGAASCSIHHCKTHCWTQCDTHRCCTRCDTHCCCTRCDTHHCCTRGDTPPLLHSV